MPKNVDQGKHGNGNPISCPAGMGEECSENQSAVEAFLCDRYQNDSADSDHIPVAKAEIGNQSVVGIGEVGIKLYNAPFYNPGTGIISNSSKDNRLQEIGWMTNYLLKGIVEETMKDQND